MRSLRLGGCAILAATMLLGLGTSTRAQVMIVGNDQKPKFDDGKVVGWKLLARASWRLPPPA